jgi:small subunit ribosomal protein S13
MSEQKYRYIVRLGDKDIDGQENLLQGLSRVTGVGLRLSKTIIAKLGLDPNSRLGYLTEENTDQIESLLSTLIESGYPTWFVNRQRDRMSGKDLHLTGGDLEFAQRNDIERLRRIRSWRGIRHTLGLKVRGQHTRTTGRGGVAVGVSRKK